jgi:hypothetical protein
MRGGDLKISHAKFFPHVNLHFQSIFQFSKILGFRTVSIVQVLKDKTKEEHDVSETGSVSVLR